MTRTEVEELVAGELGQCMGVLIETRGHKPQRSTVHRTVASIVQRLVNEGLLVLDDGTPIDGSGAPS